MSLFSRLEERMRARDSQDDPKENEKSSRSADQNQGLFGSIQLKPAEGEPSVPPPPAPGAPGRTVPSLAEAQADLDRSRASAAEPSVPASGLFRRDKPDETPRAPTPDTGESVTFSAVSLPPRDAGEIAAPVPPPEPREQAADQASIEAVPSTDKPFRVPSLSQFAQDEANNEGEREDAATSHAQPAQSLADQAPVAPAMHETSGEQTVYAPATQRQVVASTEPQTVAAQDIGPAIEALRAAETPVAVTPVAAPIAQTAQPVPVVPAPTVSVAESAPAARPEERAAPAPRPSSTSGMTPFQRLMAARAAQGGPHISRPRVERPARVAEVAPVIEAPVAEVAPIVDAPVVETPVAEVAPIVDAPVVETPVAEVAPVVEAPEIEVPVAEVAPPIEESIGDVATVGEVPQIEPPVAEVAPEIPQHEEESAPREAAPEMETVAPQTVAAQSSQFEAPELAALPTPVEATPVVAAWSEPPVPIELPPSQITRQSEQVPPLVEAAELNADAAEESIAVAPVPDETPEMEAAEPEISESELDAMASKLEAIVAQARKSRESEAAAPDGEGQSAQEAEIVPEQTPSAPASPTVEAPPEMPPSESAEPQTRPPLSLAERLARAPRAELDAAHEEAEALTPEILQPRAPETSQAPARPAGSLSFAERLAARNRLASEPPPAATQPVEPSFAPPTSMNAAPEALVTAPAVAPTAVAPTAATSPDETAPLAVAPTAATPPDETPLAVTAPDETASGPPARNASRSFSERLAARTSLDQHLQVPSEERAPTSQDLATHNAELARINEGAELSEREMKNRVLFRQKHLIFDSVIGSIDPRTLQNPTRETVRPQIESGVDAALREFNLKLEQSDRNWLVDEFTRETTDLGALVPLLEDPSVSKIVVTGANDVSVERLGRIERTGVSFRDDDHLLSLVRRIAELSGGRVDAKVPLLDRPLPDGGRIRAKVPPLAPQPTLTIEKSTGNPFVVLKRQMQEKSRGDSLPYAQLRERIQQRLLREFEGDAAALGGDQDKLRQQVEEMITSVIAEEHVAVTRAERASLVMDLLNEIVGLGPIEPLLNDPDVDEVMVNGPYQIYVERKGKLELTTQRFRDNGHVMQVIDRIVAPLGRRVDEKSPMVDGRLRDGSRFNAIIPPLALSGPTMTIRKFARDPFTMSDLINFGTLTRESAQFLQAAVEGRLNVVVSGGTGSGKTTTLNVLSSFIPSSERIVTIEDAAELQMRQEHVIRMETRPPNIEGVGEVGIRDLVKNSLRMRPDRIVVGECRGGEALDMLQAMNTGHDGSLTTAHSNGPRDTCKRLETMVMMAGFDLPVRAIREQISMAIQLIVHQERMRDGKRRVTAISEIVGMEGDVLTLQDIFRFEQEGIDDDGRILGSLQATGMRPKYYETIIDNGVQLSMDIFAPKAHEPAPRGRISERGGR